MYQADKDEDFITLNFTQQRSSVKRIKKRYFQEFMSISEINQLIEDLKEGRATKRERKMLEHL